jgi:hypothetical protein
MAKIVWTSPADIEANLDGFEAALKKLPRVPQKVYFTYNEKAAFKDGWDIYMETQICGRSNVKQQSIRRHALENANHLRILLSFRKKSIKDRVSKKKKNF